MCKVIGTSEKKKCLQKELNLFNGGLLAWSIHSSEGQRFLTTFATGIFYVTLKVRGFKMSRN